MLKQLSVLLSLCTFSLPVFGLTQGQIWDYQNELRHRDAAAIVGRDYDGLVKQYRDGDANTRARLQYRVLSKYYDLGWCQHYGRFYRENVDAYKKFQQLQIPASRWRNRMLWTVRSGAAIGAGYAAKGEYQKALQWLAWAEKLYLASPYQQRDGRKINPFAEYYNNGYDFYAMREFIRKKQQLQHVKPEYVMTVLYIVYPNVDYTAVFWGEKKGRERRSYTWQQIDYDNLAVSQALMKLAVEAMSGGKLSLKFINVKVNTRVYHNPKERSGYYSTETVRRERAGLLQRYKHDLLVDHILSNDAGATGHGGGRHISYYNLPDAISSWTTLVHEFFHCTESRFGWKAHIYRVKNGVPGWSGVPWDQMDYYSWRFRTGIAAKVQQDTAANGYSGWISRFNWGPDELQQPFKKNRSVRPDIPEPQRKGEISIRLSKSTFFAGEAVVVRLDNVPRLPGNFVTLAAAEGGAGTAGEPVAVKSVQQTIALPGVSQPGRYQVRLYSRQPDGKAVLLGSRGFRVARQKVPVLRIRTDKLSYLPGEPIQAAVDGLPGSRQDWITLVPAGTPENRFGEWQYTGGKRSMVFRFRGVPRAGIYELRVYYDWPRGGYKVRGRRRIVVRAE